MKSADQLEIMHLSEDSSWEEVALWCGGHLVNHEQGNSGEFETELVIPRGRRRKPLSAGVDDLVVKLASGEFIVYEVKEDPDTWDFGDLFNAI